VRARAIDVDSTGRFVLFVDWFGTCRVLDLRQRRRAAAPMFESVARQRLARSDPVPRAAVLPSGAVVSLEAYSLGPAEVRYWEETPAASVGPDRLGYGGLRVRDADGADHVIQVTDGSALSGVPRGLFASDDGRHVLALLGVEGQGTRVDLVDGQAARLQAVRTVPGDVTALATDGAAAAVALAVADEVRCYELPSLERLGSVPVERPLWIGLAQQTLAVVGKGTIDLHHWEAGRFTGGTRPRRRRAEHAVAAVNHASLSRDGSLLALRVADDGVAVQQMKSGARQLLLDHSAGVDLVRFVDKDRRLVVATADGKVHTWHRRGDRIAGAE
jgi:hypothetical protein